jgi:uncharacterized RDD family membrane protein YckC
MFCPQCGTETKPEAKFCHACRHPLDAASSPAVASQVPPTAKQITPPTTSTDTPPDSGIHPWRRLFARTVDMVLIVPLLYLLLFNRFGDHYSLTEFLIGTDLTGSLLEKPIVVGVMLFILWVPLEAACLAIFGATIGKFAFGIRVSGADGNRLSYGAAFDRSILVFSLGVAFGLPIVNLLTGAIAHHRLKKTGTTYWDEKAKSSVRFNTWAPTGMAICAFVVVLALISSALTPVVVAKVKGIYTSDTEERQPTSQSTAPAEHQTPKANESSDKKPTVDLEEKRKLEVAANQGDPVAQYQLGKMYFKEKNYEEAAGWMRLSVDQGYAIAQDHLANLYFSGLGVPEDPKEAVRLYRLAAKHGVAGANYSLGWAYKEGKGVPQDTKASLRYYGLAADQGDVTAMFELGYAYQKLWPSRYLTDVEQ